jgi:hypothetical protein
MVATLTQNTITTFLLILSTISMNASSTQAVWCEGTNCVPAKLPNYVQTVSFVALPSAMNCKAKNLKIQTLTKHSSLYKWLQVPLMAVFSDVTPSSVIYRLWHFYTFFPVTLLLLPHNSTANGCHLFAHSPTHHIPSPTTSTYSVNLLPWGWR